MASFEYGGGTGGKFQKRSRRAASTPYDRPQSAIRRPNLNPDSNSSWFSKIVDPASKLIAKGASMFFASVFQKRLGAPPIIIPEENHLGHESPGDVANLQNPLDVSPESGGNIIANANGTLDTSLIAAHDCETKKEPTSSLNGVFAIEQLLKQKTFTRAEFDRLSSLLRSRTIEPKSISEEGTVGTEQEKEIQQSVIEPSTSQPLSGREGEEILSEQRNENKSSALQGSNIDLAANFHIPDQAGVSPEQIAREYMGSRTPKVHSTLGAGSQKSESPIFPIVPFSKRSCMLASRNSSSISGIHEHPQNNYMTPRPRGRSAVYKNSRSPYFRASLGSNSRDGLSYASTSSPFISSIGTLSSNKQAAKRGRSVSENDIELHDPIRRTRQKSSLISQGQTELSSSSVGLVSRSVDNRNTTNVFHVPTKSTEMALKIIQQLDKLEASPREKLSETKGSSDGDMASNSPTLKLVGSLSPKEDKLKENSQPDAISTVKSDAIISSSAATPLMKEAAAQTAKDKASPELDAYKNPTSIVSVISATENKKSMDKPLPSSFKSGMPPSSILKIKDGEASNRPITKKRVDFAIPVLISKSSPERKETPVPNLSREGSSSMTPPPTLKISDNGKKIKEQSGMSQINGASSSTSSPISVTFSSPTTFIANSSASSISFATLAEPNTSQVTPASEISKKEQDIKTSVAPSSTTNSSVPQETSNAVSNTQNSGSEMFGFTASSTQSSTFCFSSQATQPAFPTQSSVFGFTSQATKSTASSNQSSVSGFASQTTQPTVFGNQSSVSGFTSEASQPTASTNQSSISGFTSQATQPIFGSNNNTPNTPNFTTSTATNLFSTSSLSSSSQPTSSMFTSSFASNPSFSFSSVATSPSPAQPVFGFSNQAQNSPGSDGMKVDDTLTNNIAQTTPVFSSNTQFTPSTQAASQPVFQFGGNGNNSSAPQNTFQTPGNFQFSANGSFSLGSGGGGGGEKAGRRIIKVRRDNKHKKK